MAASFLNFPQIIDQILTIVRGLQTDIQGIKGTQAEILQQLSTQGAKVMAAIDNLEAEVGQIHDVADSVERALDMLHQQLQDALASGDPARVQAAVDMLENERQRIVAAVVRNTTSSP